MQNQCIKGIHLGNVLEVVTDRKLPIDLGVYDTLTSTYSSTTADGIVDYYIADVVSQSDYYPFGMVYSNTDFYVDPVTGLDVAIISDNDYRYSFQGQEKDDEIKGENNSVNYKYRMHDPRVGRFFAPDPLEALFVFNSSYAFSENRVMDRIELEGLEAARFRVNISRTYTTMSNAVQVYNSVAYDFTNARVQYVYVIQGRRYVLNDWEHRNGFENHFEDASFGIFGGFTTDFFENQSDAQNNTNGVVTTWEQAYMSNPKRLWVKDLAGQTYPIVRFEHIITFTDFSVNYSTNESGNSSFSVLPSTSMGNSLPEYVTKTVDGLVYFPELKVEVIGNTSRDGTDQYNQQLSQDRATDVYNLIKGDLDTRLANGSITQDQHTSAMQRISVRGDGENAARAAGKDETNNDAGDRNVKIKFSY